MKKLMLDLEKLHVESFATDEAVEPERGTVHAQLKDTDVRYCGTGSNCYTDN